MLEKNNNKNYTRPVSSKKIHINKGKILNLYIRRREETRKNFYRNRNTNMQLEQKDN